MAYGYGVPKIKICRIDKGINMDIEAKRNEIKEEFRYYLSKVARSSRVTDGSFYLSSNAVNSYLSFLEVDKLFDYAPQKWSKILGMF